MRLKQKTPWVLLGLLLIVAASLTWYCVTRAARDETTSPAALSFVDQNGDTVSLSEPAKRVVSITIPMASMLMAIDLSSDRLFGMNITAKKDMEKGIFGRMFPEALKIPTDVAGENFAPNAEALAKVKPDLVMQWGDRSGAIIEPIRALGIPVLSFKYGDSMLAAEWIKMIGLAIGKEERANKMADAFVARVNEIAAITNAIPEDKKPTVIYLSRAKQGLIASGANTSMDSDLRRAGGINPAANLPGSATIDSEQLLAWDPDFIFLNNFEIDLSPDVFYRDPRFLSMKAVKLRQVYIYPRGGFMWDPPSQETPLSIEWIFKTLHPNHANTLGNLRQNIKTAYQELYGYKVSEKDIDEILQMDKNAKSARFTELFGEQK